MGPIHAISETHEGHKTYFDITKSLTVQGTIPQNIFGRKLCGNKVLTEC